MEVLVKRAAPPCNRMSMMTAKSEPVPFTAPAVDSRSPFVRLTELIAGIQPGKSVINLSVGEPQHPVPSFVGPTIAAHIADFGRSKEATGCCGSPTDRLMTD